MSTQTIDAQTALDAGQAGDFRRAMEKLLAKEQGHAQEEARARKDLKRAEKVTARAQRKLDRYRESEGRTDPDPVWAQRVKELILALEAAELEELHLRALRREERANRLRCKNEGNQLARRWHAPLPLFDRVEQLAVRRNADRTGPSAEARDSSCPAAVPPRELMGPVEAVLAAAADRRAEDDLAARVAVPLPPVRVPADQVDDLPGDTPLPEMTATLLEALGLPQETLERLKAAGLRHVHDLQGLPEAADGSLSSTIVERLGWPRAQAFAVERAYERYMDTLEPGRGWRRGRLDDSLFARQHYGPLFAAGVHTRGELADLLCRDPELKTVKGLGSAKVGFVRGALAADWQQGSGTDAPAPWQTSEANGLPVIERDLETLLEAESQADTQAQTVGRCIVCGCSEPDCRRCVERTGEPCTWTSPRQDLCTACLPIANAELTTLDGMTAGARKLVEASSLRHVSEVLRASEGDLVNRYSASVNARTLLKEAVAAYVASCLALDEEGNPLMMDECPPEEAPKPKKRSRKRKEPQA
jgi:hypothetical protein